MSGLDQTPLPPGTRVSVPYRPDMRPLVSAFAGRVGTVQEPFRELLNGFVEVELDAISGGKRPYFLPIPFAVTELEKLP
jgi:hypothetical protein